MNLNEYIEDVRKSLYRRITIIEKKNHDYAGEDALKNFKNMSVVLNTLKVDIGKPWGVALVYALLKIDRLCNLLNKGVEPKNESLQDTIDDLKNYIDLMEACYNETDIVLPDVRELYHLGSKES